MAEADQASAEAARLETFALSVPPAAHTGDGLGPETLPPLGQALLGAAAAYHSSGPDPGLGDPETPPPAAAGGAGPSQNSLSAVMVEALPDTPSKSGCEVHAELVHCPWADDSLDPADRARLGRAWDHLDPLGQEQAAYLLLRMLNGLENGENPKFDRFRTGALAVLSASYRRLQAGGEPGTTLTMEDEQEDEQEAEIPTFLVPLLAQLVSAIYAKARSVDAEVVHPDEKALRMILGKNKTPAQKGQAVRL